jgi:hypothetical protein
MTSPKFSNFTIPTNLGLRPSGLEQLPKALKATGLT